MDLTFFVAVATAFDELERPRRRRPNFGMEQLVHVRALVNGRQGSLVLTLHK